jgi:actin related protein 2/3 complex subunit 1A/1B
MSLIWSSESEIIAAGHDCQAYRFQGGEQGWRIAGSLEEKGGAGPGVAREESALNMFRQMDLKGKAKDDTQLTTVHQNTISTIRSYEGDGQTVRKFSSKFDLPPIPFSECGRENSANGFCAASGVDGRIVIWQA